MKHYTQTILHDPENGRHGDCLRTVIGCLLEIDPLEIPHFGERGKEWRAALQEWLRPMGLCLLEIAYVKSVDRELAASSIHGCYHMISGPSPRSTEDELLHCVVGKDGLVEHDPMPGSAGLSGSASEWIMGFIVKLN